MKFRDHRSSYEESMKTVQEFNSKQEIIDYLNEEWAKFNIEVADVQFHHLCFDERNGWDTWLVMFCFEGQDIYPVAGLSDGVCER